MNAGVGSRASRAEIDRRTNAVLFGTSSQSNVVALNNEMPIGGRYSNFTRSVTLKIGGSQHRQRRFASKHFRKRTHERKRTPPPKPEQYWDRSGFSL